MKKYLEQLPCLSVRFPREVCMSTLYRCWFIIMRGIRGAERNLVGHDWGLTVLEALAALRLGTQGCSESFALSAPGLCLVWFDCGLLGNSDSFVLVHAQPECPLTACSVCFFYIPAVQTLLGDNARSYLAGTGTWPQMDCISPACGTQQLQFSTSWGANTLLVHASRDWNWES